MFDRTDIPKPLQLKGLSIPYGGELQFRRLLEKLPVGAYTCGLDGLITYFNPHAATLWGRDPRINDPVDRFCGSSKLFTPDGKPVHHDQCWMALALRNRREYNGEEIVVERPDGQRLTVLAYANPIWDDNGGRMIGAVNVLVDITERKRMETALRQADRAKDEFLATLAHELRNPLAPVRNAVQVLQMQPGQSDDATWAVEVIERQMRHMTRLIDDLLDVSRITRDKLELRTERVELATVLRSALETARPLVDASGHELQLSLPPKPVVLDADPTRLAQAVSNLLNNAAKYTPPPGRLSLHAERQGSDAVVTVSDNGLGIAAEMLPRIFDMFVQVDGSMNRAQGGLGIGLTLVRRLVELHGGTLQAHSDGLGKGSTFTIRVPVLIEPRPRARRSPIDGLVPSAIRSSLRVVVADDNRDSANSVAMLLRLAGNDVRAAYDGREAVDLANQFRPQVVLLDIGMPQLNGYEAARQIRRSPDAGQPILIALTGWGQDEDKRRAREAGFDHHLVKPIDPRELLQLLASFQPANA